MIPCSIFDTCQPQKGTQELYSTTTRSCFSVTLSIREEITVALSYRMIPGSQAPDWEPEFTKLCFARREAELPRRTFPSSRGCPSDVGLDENGESGCSTQRLDGYFRGRAWERVMNQTAILSQVLSTLHGPGRALKTEGPHGWQSRPTAERCDRQHSSKARSG
jgi:hypothetical protein